MKKKTINPVENIYKNLFCLKKSKWGFDVDARGVDIDPAETSRNLDFKISTFQSRSENIYFNVFLYDYETKKDYFIGYFYIKDNNGIINAEHLQALAEIIAAGNIETENIFKQEA